MNHAVGCGCNYPLFTSAVFAPTPVNDMWTAWGPCINFWDIGLVKEYKQIKAKEDLTVTLGAAASRPTLLSGIEIVAADVALGTIPRILPLDSDPWLGGE
jgi:hypothetical protein